MTMLMLYAHEKPSQHAYQWDGRFSFAVASTGAAHMQKSFHMTQSSNVTADGYCLQHVLPAHISHTHLSA